MGRILMLARQAWRQLVAWWQTTLIPLSRRFWPWFARTDRRTQAAIGVGALLAVCVLCSGLATAFGGGATTTGGDLTSATATSGVIGDVASPTAKLAAEQRVWVIPGRALTAWVQTLAQQQQQQMAMPDPPLPRPPATVRGIIPEYPDASPRRATAPSRPA